MKARVIKIVSNQFTLSLQGEIIQASLSGKMRLKNKVILGDFVEVEEVDCEYRIIDVYNRLNCLYRPVVANIDQAFVVMSVLEPNFDYKLVNRLLYFIEYNQIKPILLITKKDLNEELANQIKTQYNELGYESYCVSKFDENLEFVSLLKDKVSTLAGQSGAGKSSLMNCLDRQLNLKTQEISKALNRGKHTTTHHELYQVSGGYLADTPGFSNLVLNELDFDILKSRSKFLSRFKACRYLNCNHLKEPDCCLKQYIKQNGDSIGMYAEYVDLWEKVKKEKKW